MSHVALTKCYFCGEGNAILLHKRLQDVSRFQGKVVDMEPCNECKDLMSKGVMLIGIDDEKSEHNWYRPRPGENPDTWIPNPYRTGSVVVIKDEALERIVDDPSLSAWGIKHRFMFIEDEALKKIQEQAAQPT